LVTLALICFSCAHQCTFNTTSGFYYDFTKMRDLGDLSYSTNKGKYYVQICSEVISHCGSAKSSVCLKSDGKTINEGDTRDAQWSIRNPIRQDEGVTVIYSNGDKCGNDHSKRKTIVNYQCQVNPLTKSSPQVGHKREIDQFGIASLISSIDDSDDCTTIINIETPFACAVNKKFFSDCGYRMTKEACFDQPASGCHCGWCGSRCVAAYEKCHTVREIECRSGLSSIHLSLLGAILSAIAVILTLCLCVCVCIKRRQYSKMMRIRQGMKIPTQRFEHDVAMEPLMTNEMSEMIQPQFVYVQVPMNNSEQQNPPYFAPQPFFYAPQLIQPNEQ